MTAEEKRLSDLATRYLQEKGFSWDGRQKGEVTGQQRAFELRARPTPTGGKPK